MSLKMRNFTYKQGKYELPHELLKELIDLGS